VSDRPRADRRLRRARRVRVHGGLRRALSVTHYRPLLGIPREHYPQFHGWATDLGLLFSYAVAEHRPRIEAALLGLAACVDDLLAERRAAPGPDLISALIAVEESGDQLSDAELRVLVTGLVFAG
jgi:cytochrome P450